MPSNAPSEIPTTAVPSEIPPSEIPTTAVPSEMSTFEPSMQPPTLVPSEIPRKFSRRIYNSACILSFLDGFFDAYVSHALGSCTLMYVPLAIFLASEFRTVIIFPQVKHGAFTRLFPKD